MIRFILNEKEIATGLEPGTTLLDFIRYNQHLPGTKIGCREGDCGACTVLVGEMKNNQLTYRSMTSCLMPLGNAHGKHIVTIEGINRQDTNELNPIQKAMADEGATQCGFCTPGFVMSLAGFCLDNNEPSYKNAIAAIDGNICRCTGYKSIERAAKKIVSLLKDRNDKEPAVYAAGRNILPVYFSTIKEKLSALLTKTDGGLYNAAGDKQVMGGGTDMYVQKHDEMKHASMRFLFDDPQLKGISTEGNRCILGAATTVTDLLESEIIKDAFPSFARYAWLVSSTPIRNMATIAGNFVNASPIGDFTIFFLALDAQLILSEGCLQRELPLRKFYKGYKQLDKSPSEYIEQLWFELPTPGTKFHFEKVSKRTNLDIASVNTAISLSMDGNRINKAGLSAGGVGPVPLYLQRTSSLLSGKTITENLVREVVESAKEEITPISDARGTAGYKKLLLGQLIKAHFLELFPELKTESFLMHL